MTIFQLIGIVPAVVSSFGFLVLVPAESHKKSFRGTVELSVDAQNFVSPVLRHDNVRRTLKLRHRLFPCLYYITMRFLHVFLLRAHQLMLELRIKLILGCSWLWWYRTCALLLWRISSARSSESCYPCHFFRIKSRVCALESVALLLLQSLALTCFFAVITAQQGFVNVFIVCFLNRRGYFFSQLFSELFVHAHLFQLLFSLRFLLFLFQLLLRFVRVY